MGRDHDALMRDLASPIFKVGARRGRWALLGIKFPIAMFFVPIQAASVRAKTDRDNPMLPEVGHVAIIVPNFADRTYLPGQIGIYEYRGRRQWTDRSDDAGRYFAVRRFARSFRSKMIAWRNWSCTATGLSATTRGGEGSIRPRWF